MGIIYREVVRYKKTSFIKGLILVMLTILATNILVNSWGYSTRYNIQVGFILIAGSVIAALILKEIYSIVYIHRICYTYKLIDKELIFEKAMGKSRKIFFSVNTRDIERIIPANNTKSIKGIDRTYKFLCDFSKDKAYCCIVNQKGEKIALYVQPSEALIRKLNNVTQGAFI
jgi:hypothetical protein